MRGGLARCSNVPCRVARVCRLCVWCVALVLRLTVGAGLLTGNCVPAVDSASSGACEIAGWCPDDFDSAARANMSAVIGAENFTVFVKSNVVFSRFGASFSSVGAGVDLLSCKWNASAGLLCPIFRMRDLLAEVGTTMADIALSGAVIAINIDWDCDLDADGTFCSPVYTFLRCVWWATASEE